MGHVRGAAALVLALPLGCVDFHGQALTWRYDRGSDTLRVFIVYEAIHVAAEDPAVAEPPITQKEKDQLESVVRGRRAFFFDNWLSEFDGERMEREIRDLRTKLADAAPDERRRLESDLELLEAATRSVAVKNGRFYLNGKGQLCGWQYVTVTGVTRLVPLINAWGTRRARAMKDDGLGKKARERLQAFAERQEWVRIEGNQIRIRAALSYEEFAKARKDVWGNGRKPLDFRTQEAVLNYDEPIAEVILGRLDRETAMLERPAEDRLSGALAAYVRDTYGLAPEPDVQALRTAFIQTGKIPD